MLPPVKLHRLVGNIWAPGPVDDVEEEGSIVVEASRSKQMSCLDTRVGDLQTSQAVVAVDIEDEVDDAIDVGEQVRLEQQEGTMETVSRELVEERPNNFEDLDVDAENEFWNGGDRDGRGEGVVHEEEQVEGGEAEAEALEDAILLPSLEEAHCTYVPTHKWPPKAVRSEFTRVATSLWQQVAENPGDIKLWVKLLIFSRCILPAGQGPNLGDPSSQVDLIRARLRRWNNHECGELWKEAVEKQSARPRRGRRKRGANENLTQEQKNVKRCATQAGEGQFTRAMQSLTSSGMAEYSEASIKEMQSKHPPAPRPLPPSPTTDTSQRTFTTLEVFNAALSFRKGTAAGPSGLRPEHLQVTLKCSPASLAQRAQAALLKLVNVLAKGSLPAAVSPFFCGARLHAATKKDQSLRPIAVGNLMRRLVAKCFSTALAEKAATLFSPNQLGVGVRAGAEAIPQAVKKVIEEDPSKWVLQCDLINAYNCVERGAVLQATAQHFPECLAWVVSCYGTPSHLRYGSTSINSETGLHQGDPLAGLLFCLAIKPVVDAIQEEVPNLVLNAWYLDDGHQVGTKEDLKKVVDIFSREGPPRGLILSTAASVKAPSKPKALVWSPAGDLEEQDIDDPIQRGIPMAPQGEGITVLGAPVGSEEFIARSLAAKVNKVEQITDLLPLLQDPHIEFALLRSCLALPKVMFLLRAVDTTKFPNVLEQFDAVTRGALSRILGSPVSNIQWEQAKLPVAMGGTGLRSASDHAPIAHATSLLSAQPLIKNLLGNGDEESYYALPQDLLDCVSARQGEEATTETLTGISQKQGSLKVDLANKSVLVNFHATVGSQREIARMNSLGLPHQGDWLSVVPCQALGLHLRGVEFTFCLKYRLGMPLFSAEGPCPHCKQQNDVMGDHALGCAMTRDRIARHNLLRDVLYETAASAALGPVREEKNLLPGRAARPGDIFLRHWSSGKDAALDVTVTNSLASSHVAGTAAEAGSALNKVVKRKVDGAAEACRDQGIVFLPLAVETLGGMHKVAVQQVKQLAAALARHTGQLESTTTSHLFQRFSLNLMRGNSVMLTTRAPNDDFPQAQVDGEA